MVLTTSIILCTYQGETYLPQQLESILYQTTYPDELVIADDGSTDSTLEIAQEFKNKAPFPVKVIQNETKLGYINNFMKHFLESKTDLVFFSDQDDIWYPNKIEHLIELKEEQPEFVFAFSNTELINDQSQIIDPNFFRTMKLPFKWKDSGGDFFSYFLKNTRVINGCFSAYSKEIRELAINFLNGHPQYEIKIGHDHFLNSLAALSYPKERIVLIPEILMKHREHDQQTVGIGLGEYNHTIEKVKSKKSERRNHLNITKKHLKELIEIGSLVGSDTSQINLIEGYRRFNDKRMANDGNSILKRILFSFKNLLNANYHKNSQFPIKEMLRDLL